jgi:hypothetical protein
MKIMAIALISLVVAGAPVSACSSSTGTGPPTVSKADLEAEITKIVKEVGVTPESVTCRDDLVGEVGQSTQCEIEAAPLEALLAPIVTVTSVEDSKVNWQLTPALTQKQVERTVADAVKQTSGTAPDSVSCESGLAGETGNEAHCNVTTDGATVRRTMRVTKVENLEMNYRLLPMLTRAQLEQSLLNELAPQIGQRPDTVTCSGDLDGWEGNTVECTAVAGPESEDFLLTVDSVNGEQILYHYEPAQ